MAGYFIGFVVMCFIGTMILKSTGDIDESPTTSLFAVILAGLLWPVCLGFAIAKRLFKDEQT